MHLPWGRGQGVYIVCWIRTVMALSGGWLACLMIHEGGRIDDARGKDTIVSVGFMTHPYTHGRLDSDTTTNRRSARARILSC